MCGSLLLQSALDVYVFYCTGGHSKSRADRMVSCGLSFFGGGMVIDNDCV